MNLAKVLDMVPNKRVFVAKMLGQLGLLRALERTMALRYPGLTVLTYHRIAQPETNSFYDPVISSTPDSFRAQVEWLCDHTRILALEELIDRAQSNSPWQESTVLITFDDGYRDNFDVALPILAERNVPATFFLPTEFLDTPQVPWWDYVAYVIKRTRVCRLRLERSFKGRELPLDVDLETMPQSTAIMTIVRALLDDTVDDECWFLHELARRAEVDVDTEALGRSLFVSWDQVRQLTESDTDFTIGSHSQSHSNLARLDDESQYREMTVSKQVLERHVGCEIKAFAYPYGWPGTYTTHSKALVAQAGYRLAFTSREGINRPNTFDPLEISRLGVGAGDSTDLLRARAALHAVLGRSFL
jgi:peptidoglycan/xylan/chitin deacetylase (PgdA/CDA1 family)